MSYLLDALRKSELERRVGEVPDLTPDLSVQPIPKRRYRWGLLIIGLVVINLGTLAYITFVDRGRSDSEENPRLSTPSPVKSTSESSAKPSPQPTRVSPEKPAALVRSPSKEKATPSIESPSLSKQPKPVLKEITQSDNKSNLLVPVVKKPPTIPETRTTKTDEKRVPVAKSTPRPKTQTSLRQKSPREKASFGLSRKPKQTEKVVKTPVNQEKPKSSKLKKTTLVEPAKILPARPPRTNTPSKAKVKTIPLLAGMPRDFQREFPSMNINVFVYSEIPKERFVIIDMVKYVSGQKIDSGAEILDIRHDSVVLQYHGQKFRVKRP